MANKPVTTDVGANAQYNSSTINGNFTVIENAVEGCLGRGGTSESPNSMQGDLDMDLHKIINVGAPSNDNDAVRLIDLSDSDATGSASAQLRIEVIPKDSVAALKTSSLESGVYIDTKGYYLPGDGGGATYLIRTAAEYGGTPDEYGDHTLTNGNIAVLQNTEVNAKQYGAKGDGVTDDTLSLQALFNGESSIDLKDDHYIFTSSITSTYTVDTTIKGNGAILDYGGSHIESAVSFNLSNSAELKLSGFEIDGNLLCNKGLEVLNNTSMSTASRLTVYDCGVKHIKRINTEQGGEAILVRGAFDSVVLKSVVVADCELPTGQGTPGVIGISGITCTFYSATSYIHRCTLDNVDVSLVYSSDSTYTSDQDGIRFFSPADPVDAEHKIPSMLVVKKCKFYNCFGRSIKTQCRSTMVSNTSFLRDDGFDGFTGNGEIDSQYGNLMVNSCTFDYRGGYQPRSCVNASSNNTANKTGVNIRDCEVYLDSSTTLEIFAQAFPSGGTQSQNVVQGNKVYGEVQAFVELLCNDNKTHLTASDNYVEEIVDRDSLGLNFIYVKTSGATSPFYAYLSVENNYYDGASSPYLVMDNVPTVAMICSISAKGNFGFVDNGTSALSTGGQRSTNALRANRFASEGDVSGFMEVQSFTIAAGATQAVTVKNIAGCLLFINVNYNNTAYAIISSQSAANLTISAGAGFGVGNAADPGAGLFRVWSTGSNSIALRNTDASARTFSVFAMIPF